MERIIEKNFILYKWMSLIFKYGSIIEFYWNWMFSGKASFPILVTDFGIEILRKDEHPINEKSPIDSKLEFISKITSFNDEQPSNANIKIDLTEKGIDTWSNFEQSLNE